MEAYAHPSMYGAELTEAMANWGLDDGTILAALGANYLRVFEQVWDENALNP